MNRCLVLFVEGDMEIEFYRRVITNARQKYIGGAFNIGIECVNVKNPMGSFKNIALWKFIKKIRPKYDKECEFTVVFCRDAKVFELSSKPDVNWDEVEKEFIENGVQHIFHIKAQNSIEDWFLLDMEGILDFLQLPKKMKISGDNGYEKLKKLFKKADKIYYKGMGNKCMVEHLNIEKIVHKISNQLYPLYNELGIKI